MLLLLHFNVQQAKLGPKCKFWWVNWNSSIPMRHERVIAKRPERCKIYDGDCCANVCWRCPASLSKVNFISWSLFFNWHQMQVSGIRIGYYPKGCGCFTLMFYWWISAVPITGTASGDSLVKLALSSKDPSPTLFSALKSSKEKEWF